MKIAGVYGSITGMEKRLIFKNEEETAAFGLALAAELKAGDVLALIGDLGAGKTALAKAVAKGLGIKEELSSPTFTIVHEYAGGRLPLYHFDLYRVHEDEELFEIGFDEYFRKGGVCIIEWADLAEHLLPGGTKTVRLYYGEEEGERICETA